MSASETLLLRRIDPDRIDEVRRAEPVDPETLAGAARIIERLRAGAEPALRELAIELDGRAPDAPLLLGRGELDHALERIPSERREILERAAGRIREFATAQRRALNDVDVPIPGGRAGHRVVPMARAGCYAPGGRYPLPSSVLMTGVTARAAGVETVVVATPSDDPIMLAAASIAGADALLHCGGAHAIGALAHGVPGLLEPVDVIVGPGNRWVTAAKKLVAGVVAIDMLAGPSELLVLADDSADPRLVAADLLAQAEHDDDAVPVLIATDGALVERVEAELDAQLRTLPTAPTARRALRNGFACVCDSLDDAIRLSDRVAPEHLEIHTRDATGVGERVANAGALFVGAGAAEVFGDYALGPNHTLPTGATARFGAGLSVFDFLRVRTWLATDPAEAESLDGVIGDVAAFARLEGLEAHARAAEARRPDSRRAGG